MSTFNLQNPNTGAVGEEFERFQDSDRDALLNKSTEAYQEWRTWSVTERARALFRLADLYEQNKAELADIIGREMGKMQRWAEVEVDVVVDIYRYYAENAHAILAPQHLPAQGADHTYVTKEPIGPLLGIMPWNFPYYQVARWAGPNMLLGNTVVLKHASICPLSSQRMQELTEEAGIPAGVFQNIHASGSQMDAIIADPRIKGVSLTGSEKAGAAVSKTASENLKKSVMELGGNDPMLVIDDENLDWVLEKFVKIRMYNTGQHCFAPKRLIVLEDFYDRAKEFLTKRIPELTVGDYKSGKDVGPLSSVGARDEIVARLEKAKANGDAQVLGGAAIDGPGAYMEPALLTDVEPTADVGCNEIFGPVAILIKAKDVDDAVRIANETDYGLSASVWAADPLEGEKVAQRLEAGMVWVNEHAVTAAGLPFGGIGISGFGRELGMEGADEFANKKLYRVRPQDEGGQSPAF